MKRSFDIWLLAHNKGDEKFKSAVQQLNMKIPSENKEGVEQIILFDEIADQKLVVKSLQLTAISSAGLPVYYYVREGPAFISGSKVEFTKIPPRTKFPVKVVIVAWQYGIKGKVRTAKPLELTFHIYK